MNVGANLNHVELTLLGVNRGVAVSCLGVIANK